MEQQEKEGQTRNPALTDEQQREYDKREAERSKKGGEREKPKKVQVEILKRITTSAWLPANAMPGDTAEVTEQQAQILESQGLVKRGGGSGPRENKDQARGPSENKDQEQHERERVQREREQHERERASAVSGEAPAPRRR